MVRGVTRPGVLAEENELAGAAVLPDCFRLRWTKLSIEAKGEMPTATMECEIRYETAGSTTNARMDRGRALIRMDAELRTALAGSPQNAAKKNYAALADGGTATVMATNIWWGEATFGEMKTAGDRLTRTVTVPAMSCEEAGEL